MPKHCTLCDNDRTVEWFDPESNHHRVPPETVPCPACTVKCLHCGAEGFYLPEGTQQLTEWHSWPDPERRVWCDPSCLSLWIERRRGSADANIAIIMIARDIVVHALEDWDAGHRMAAIVALDTMAVDCRKILMKEMER